MKFLNLSTGYSFDGLWTNEQTKGYVFWFPNEQSTGITYVMPIAVITDNAEPLSISIEDNSVFSLISHNNIESHVDGYTFSTPIYNNNFVTEPEKVNNKYIHIFNVSCSSNTAGEYICKVNIDDAGYIRVGADLYDEHEAAYINLSNMGVEIPTTVQKAIYDSNVHEDLIDNILINRKFKELLSNYWDIIANKGSYKSLKNALSWFEWGDVLKIREIWKQDKCKTFFSDKEIMSSFEHNVENAFTNFVKTTYISIYCALQNDLDSYDEEKNPELEQAIFKWSKEDIQLKLSLLAQYFGAYFMPIHMSILHATVEDKVFTNTIKTIYCSGIERTDCFGDFNYVECNINDGDTIKLGNVRAQVTDGTIFGVKGINDKRHFGVDLFPSKSYVDESFAYIFDQQYYTGPGVIIPFKLSVSNQSENDFIKQTIVDLNDERFIFYDKFTARNNRIGIKFNLLLKEAKEYNIRFSFLLASGKTVTRSVNFVVEDADNININIYKVKAKDDSNGFTKDDFLDTSICKYFYSIQPNDAVENYCSQHLSYMLPSDHRYATYDGIKLNRTVVVDVKNNMDSEILFLRSIMYKDFLEFAKYDYTDPDNPKMKYLIFVSKKFYGAVPKTLNNNVFYYSYDVIRNDLGFYPQFHYLHKMEGNNIDDYTVSQYEAVCCAPEINGSNGTEDFRYGHQIDRHEWTFTNSITGKAIDYNVSSRQPFIADHANPLSDGYYNIEFNYSLSNGIIGRCRLDSAFRIKSI